MKPSLHIAVLLLIAGLATFGYAQIIPANTNLAYLLHSEAPFHISHKVYTKGKQNYTLLRLSLQGNTVFDSLVFSYSYAASLASPVSDFVAFNLSSFTLVEDAQQQVFAIPSFGNEGNYLILKIQRKGEPASYAYSIDLRKNMPFFITKPGLTNPVLSGYVAQNTLLQLGRLQADSSLVVASFFSQKPAPALPPMATLQPTLPFKKADTTLTLSARQPTLPTAQAGMYALFEEGKPDRFSVLKITEGSFPKLTTIEQIIESSIYLFTQKEYKRLTTSAHPKKDYDAFWLENTGNPKKAARMISTYFTRVKQANSWFTSVKEGWKTDMGMIYIIFGAPDKVLMSDNGLSWRYEKTYELPTMVFDFYLQNEQLADYYYVLQRDSKHRSNWFRAIDLWRKGRKNL